jgi:branched-chain amino acid aminotransferase
VERDIARGELVNADELFLTGTAAELTPVREVDDIPLGDPGPITLQIQGVFDDTLCGRAPQYAEWLDIVPVRSTA